VFVSNTAIIDPDVSLGDSVSIWHGTHLRSHVVIGAQTTVGENCYLGVGVSVGSRCKIQNNCQIYEPAEINQGVFIGPNVIFTNDRHPRAINPDFTQKGNVDWKRVGVHIEVGASIGAGSVIVAPVRIGAWAMVAAGSVVVKNVPAFALVVGHPAKQVGWVGRHGVRLLQESEELFVCPASNVRYRLSNSILHEVT
jgi:UDP-2-acetamido-3-amino-2,3-dideoxy-glucuronate N-acetyltransferase